MGQQQSKDELVYQQVIEGNVEAIKALCREGASFEWRDKDGKTPLILACMDPRLYIVAKTLIDLGANLNAYRPGRHAGTPLHHAAKRGLDQTANLLLEHGANPFVRNDDCQTPLDVARTKEFTNVVRGIEDYICYFSGHVREFFGPGFLEALAPQLLSRKIWAVVTPCNPPNSRKPPKLELAVYSTLQDARPRTVVSLSKSKVEEPKFHHSDPILIIFDQYTKTRYKFGSAVEGDKQQLRRLYNACKGISQVIPSSQLINAETPSPALLGAVGSAVAGQTSQQSAANNRHQFPNANSESSSATNGWGDVASSSANNDWGPSGTSSSSKANSSGWLDEPAREEHNGWGVPHAQPTAGEPSQQIGAQPTSISHASEAINEHPAPVTSVAPSAPPLPEDLPFDEPIHYPTIDITPIDLPVPEIAMTAPNKPSTASEEAKGESDISSCIICFEAQVEGACIPCGHMAGCMSCLKEIKAKKGVCPVCRTKIAQVIRIYAV